MTVEHGGSVTHRTSAEQTATLIDDIRTVTGLEVVERTNGYSVQRRGGRQVGVFTTTAGGWFRWGWVEHLSGTGRTDYTTYLPFLEALLNHTEGTRP